MKLTDDNFLLYAMHHYDNIQCHSIEEFEEDLRKFLYLKKLFSRYKNNGELRERLILNHIIVLNNCFGPDILCKILYLKLKPQMMFVKPFLILLNQKKPFKLKFKKTII